MHPTYRDDALGPRSVPVRHDRALTGHEVSPFRPLTCEQVLDRVDSDGAFVVFGDTHARTARAVWHADLRRGAGARGMELAIRDMGGGVLLVSDSTHSEQAGQIEDTLREAVAEHTAGAVPAPDPTRDHPSRGAHLRVIRDAP